MVRNKPRHFWDAVETLYRQRGWLVLLANSYIQNIDESEDIVNDSFISLLENVNKLEDNVLKSYLASTVKNKCLNWLKRRNLEQTIFNNMKIRAIDAQNISVLENDKMGFNLFRREVIDICHDSLQMAGKLSSDIFIDRLNGLSHKEIAEKYNLTHRQVSYEITKILSILKSALKDYLPVFITLAFLQNVNKI